MVGGSTTGRGRLQVCSPKGAAALQIAVGAGAFDACEVLLAHGKAEANVAASRSTGQLPLDMAACSLKIRRLLRKYPCHDLPHLEKSSL